VSFAKRKELGANLRAIFAAPDREGALAINRFFGGREVA
jgi:hypothetical protein